MSELPSELPVERTDLAQVFAALHEAIETCVPAGILNFEMHGDAALPPPIESVAGDEENSIVIALRSLKNVLGLSDDISVVNPGSHVVVSVAKAFGKERVTHVDPDGRAIDCLQRNGYEAVNSRIEDYVPQTPHDLMVAINSYGVPTDEVLASTLKPGGIIITNNYTGWAADIAKGERARLIGAVLPYYEAENATFKPADELEPGTTDIVTRWYNGRTIERVDGPGPGNWSDDAAKYPDGLFVFQMAE